ncbi:MAG: OmpH family outer membrane protein [Bacteroidia bacterium]|nr:OmpH family outer membrane protein [Bacteroidia bacterium]
MKNISLILNAILFIAVIILFVLHFSSKSSSNKESATVVKKTTDSIPANTDIAYINVDSLLKKYNLYEELENKLMEKQKGMESDLNRKSAAFEKEAAEFQKKVQNNSFLSQESAQRQEQDLMEKQQNLYKLREDLSNELMLESQNLEKQLLDTVTSFLKEFNKDGKYRFILNSATFLYGNSYLNITDTVVGMLNSRYQPAIKKE